MRCFGWAGTFYGDLSMVLGRSQQHHSAAPLRQGDVCPSFLRLPLSVCCPSRLGAGVPRLPGLGHCHGENPHTTAQDQPRGSCIGWAGCWAVA